MLPSGPSFSPTVTQRVRDFLAAASVAPPPWSSSAEATEALVAQLRTRPAVPGRDAPRASLAQSPELAALLAALREAASRTVAPEAEVLTPAAIAHVVAELEDALRTEPVPVGPGALRRFLGARSAPALAALLLLGGASMAGGCFGGDSDQTTQHPDAAPPKADARPDASLVDMFKSSTPDAIADALEELLDGGNVDARPVVLYKGITL